MHEEEYDQEGDAEVDDYYLDEQHDAQEKSGNTTYCDCGARDLEVIPARCVVNELEKRPDHEAGRDTCTVGRGTMHFASLMYPLGPSRTLEVDPDTAPEVEQKARSSIDAASEPDIAERSTSTDNFPYLDGSLNDTAVACCKAPQNICFRLCLCGRSCFPRGMVFTCPGPAHQCQRRHRTYEILVCDCTSNKSNKIYFVIQSRNARVRANRFFECVVALDCFALRNTSESFLEDFLRSRETAVVFSA